jgi:carbon monoxide dehydrogenase subunit G
MLQISVSSHRNFEIGCDLARVEQHLREFDRVLEDLPALKVVTVWGPNQYRIAYSAVIAGVYQVDLLSDVQVRLDTDRHLLAVSPLQGCPAVAAQATLRSLTGQGQYTSTMALQSQGSRTAATYDVGITATIPKPVRLSLVPDLIARNAVQAVVKHRLDDITSLFIERTVQRLEHQPIIAAR